MADDKSSVSNSMAMASRERDRDRELLIPVADDPADDSDSNKPSASASGSGHHHSGREAFYKVVRSWASKKFMTGCVILFPIAITFYITWWFIHFVDGFFSPIYAQLGINIFGLGFITSILFIFLVGVFMSSWLGASVLGLGEWFIKRMPFVRHIYNASKQISSAISPDQNTQAFKEVAIIRHPRIGEYAFGFITSAVVLQSYSGEEELCCVYVPTNHLYIGDVFLINSKDVIRPNLSVREGIATTLTGLHFATTTLMTLTLRWLGYIQASHLPVPDLLKFVLFANLSIVGMNVSLMWNSVGFYQIAKLCMIPVSCFLEVLFDKIHYSRDTKLSIMVVLIGVAVCTVSDVSVNTKGLIAAVIAVWSTALQQYYVHFLQRKYSLGSFNLLGHTAPVQAASLLIVGPFVDFWLTNKRVDAFDYNITAVSFLILSCTIAVGTNLSQFICIGRFTAVSFQVIGHMKTILVLVLGFFLFGKEGLNLHVVLGMILAVIGMIWYGNASSKPGGKERRSYSTLNDKSHKHGVLSDSIEADDKV